MKKYLLIVMSAVLLVSCKDMLNTAPSDSLPSSEMWTSESYADKGMTGLYRVFYTKSTPVTNNIHVRSGFEGICRQLWMGMEFQSIMTESEGLAALVASTKTATDVAITIEWQFGYTGIHRCNDAIQNLYKAGLSTEKYERYICEAKFLRAFFYTRLNKIFQGVPVYLEPIDEDECTRGQSTSAEVWQVVIDDCTDCIECDNFPENTLTENYGRPSKGAAYSLRGMAYMWLAWENGEDNSYYQLAANDFLKVAECGYSLYQLDSYIDFFCEDNEKNAEMIFPLQFTSDAGYCDYLQLIVAGRDSYDGWSHVRPSFSFVSYYQNANGSDFDWAERIPEWNDDVFVNNDALREVFFLRNDINTESDGTVIQDDWLDTEVAQLQERVNAIGLDVFKKYYLVDGNEDRLRSCFNDRDPRLKQTVLTPYDPYDTYRLPDVNDGKIQIGKEKRWPSFNYSAGGDYTDYYVGVNIENTYLYKKFVYTGENDLIDRLHYPTDWPLIRYTDIYLYLAECYVHLGNLSGAVDIVNEIRTRAGMPTVSVGSTDEVMEAVRYERRVELCCEGVDYFDEWRWGTYQDMKFQGKEIYGTTNYWGQYSGVRFTWYYRDYMFPWSAPSEECDRNPNLTRLPNWAY